MDLTKLNGLIEALDYDVAGGYNQAHINEVILKAFKEVVSLIAPVQTTTIKVPSKPPANTNSTLSPTQQKKKP